MQALLNTNVYLLMIIAIVYLGALLLIIKLVHGGFKSKSIYHFKSDLKEVSKSEKSNIKNDKTEIFLGTSGKKKIYLKSNANNVYVCGTTGSGKTVTLSNFIKYGIDNNMPLLVIDGKGDTNEGSLFDIVKKLKGKKKLYVIDLNNPQKSDKYNPFSNTNYTVVKDMLINMTDWSEEHYKYNTERFMQRLVELLSKTGIPLSLKSIAQHMSTDHFEALSARLLKDEVITKQEHIDNLELAKYAHQIIMGASARFSTIIESELGVIFDDTGIDIKTALQERAIILFILNPLIYPELSTLVGRLITIDAKKAISYFYHERIDRGFFIFDEINVYASDTLLNLVNKSRSANITSILASQSLSDLEEHESEHFREQIIENCNNYIIMRQNSAKNSEIWANIIGTKETMNVTYQIKSDSYSTSDTGLGSARRTREYIYHPDEIKNLPVGAGYFVSKDNNFKTKIIINKPF